MNRFSPVRFRRALSLLSLLAVPAFGHAALADTVVTAPAAVEGTVAVVPDGPKIVGSPVIVAAAVDTSGNADTAKRALVVANAALKATPGYAPVPDSQYAPLSKAGAAAALKGVPWVWPFTATDYQKIGKATKAPFALTVSVTPAADGSFGAVAKLFRTKDGALTGYGKGNSAATATGDDSLDSAVSAAVIALGETIKLPGIIVSKPEGYLARLSLGTASGARGGGDVEYLGEDGQPIAYGTIIDIAAGECVATVAPETAYSDIFINGRVQLVNNPSEKRALPSFGKLQEKDYNTFERNFAFTAAVATAVYYLAIKD